MPNMALVDSIKEALAAAATACFAHAGADCQVTPCRERKFGDYQSNFAFHIAKREKLAPRDAAAAIVKALPENEAIETATVAGAGFINIRVKDAALTREAAQGLADPRCGVPLRANPLRVVVDYSSPNLAKDLHVGTLRSTVIGDSIARILEFLGHEVLRQNHYGDWGANFGVLVALLKQRCGDDLQQMRVASLEEVEELYAAAVALKETDAEFAQRAAAEVKLLQAGDPDALAIWGLLMEKTLQNCHELYRRLNVSLDESHDSPESAYREDLPRVVAELEAKQLLTDSDNAKCAYLEGFQNVAGDPLPVLVQKSDEGYNYATTELAALRHRVNRLGAQRIIIVTDRGQQLHFQMIEALARKAGWLSDAVELRHLGYGVVLQEVKEGGAVKKTRFKTRQGGTVKIRDLLAEGVKRNRSASLERTPDLDEAELEETAERLTLAALKYADLKQRPEMDYTFNWEQMLASQGNTGIYIMYCHVRIASLMSKAGAAPRELEANPALRVSHELERELLLRLLAFPELFADYENALSAHVLCGYLYELASLYSQFWKHCPILSADAAVKQSRLALSLAVARRIKLGLSLLGVKAVDRM